MKVSTNLPPDVVNTALFLFSHGLADPANGTYREATIETSDIWRGNTRSQKVHAFQIGSTNKVVAWSGLEYEATSLGKSIDLAQDVRSSLSNIVQGAGLGHFGNSEGVYAASPNHVTASLLLLRYGRSDLAEEVYTRVEKNAINSNRLQSKDAWFHSTRQYLSNRYDRALAAHMRGDDHLALTDFSNLSQNYKSFVHEADRRLSKTQSQDDSEVDPSNPIAFIYSANQLAEDIRERIDKPQKPIDLQSLDAKTQPERIRLLITAMNQIDERKGGQPGSVSINQSPIIKALISEGDAAVEPLMDCIETDQRYTRSVGFARDFSVHRNPISVATCARVALDSLLRVSTSETSGQLWPVDKIREYWKVNKGITLEAAWYRDLLDDSTDYRTWELAARNITSRATNAHAGGLPPLRGESLRYNREPTVTQLFHRRALELIDVKNTAASRDAWKAKSGIDIALASYVWDRQASLPTLQAVSHDVLNPKSEITPSPVFLARVSRVFAVRMKLGDRDAIDEYTKLLTKLSHQSDPHIVGEVGILQVLWEQQNSPKIRELANRIFLERNSQWNIQNWTKSGVADRLVALVNTPALLIPGFRKALAEAILIHTDWATGRIERRDSLYTLSYRAKGGQGILGNQENVPANRIGEDFPITSSDFLILNMRTIRGLPKFEAFWDEGRKSKARQKVVAFLLSNHDFKSSLSKSTLDQFRTE